MAVEPPHETKLQQEWIKETIQFIHDRLNWLDLAFFGLGAFILLIVLMILLRKKKRIFTKTVEKIKREHLEEIKGVERRVQSFKKRLEEVEVKYEEELQKRESHFAKRVQKIEKGYSEIQSTDEVSIFELKQEIRRLRERQMDEIEAFQKEITDLKNEMKGSHEGHAKEIERAEMEISDLRKQLHALMYRI
ncbi:MAG: hypothetical protein KDK76_07975 [Chlamydiia bacterium]|nr:hypothetical protein [Chlamydiia bacterium]